THRMRGTDAMDGRGRYEKKLIRAAVVPMYAAPSVQTEQVSQAILGETVELLEARGAWRRIRTGDGYDGWLPASTLGEATAEWSGEMWEVLPLWANLRYLPDSRMAARITAFAGTRLPLAEARTGWIGLRLPEGAVGWTEAHRARRWPGAAGGLPAATAVVDT